MDAIDQTRFKYGMIFVAVVFIEGVLKAFLPAFPFLEAIAAQGGAFGVYTVAKSVNNQASIKTNGTNGVK
jgi:hypothetical protein